MAANAEENFEEEVTTERDVAFPKRSPVLLKDEDAEFMFTEPN